jgi:hypothetical protein
MSVWQRRWMTTITVLLAVGALSSPAPADMVPFTLETVPAGKDAVLSLPIMSNSKAALTLVRTAAKGPESVDVRLTQFRDDAGRLITVTLIVGEGTAVAEAVAHQGVKVREQVVPLQLSIPELPSLGARTGLLVVSAGQYDPGVWRITLIPGGGSRPATLEASPRSITVLLDCLYRCRAARGADVSVSLRDKTGKWPLEGISVRQEQTTGGFDLRNLAFWLNSAPAAHPGSWNPRGAAGEPPVSPAAVRWTAPGLEPVVVGIAAHDLSVGEHTTTLRFSATNSTDDDGQKVTLLVRVRHSILWAVLLLLGALLVSFVATKVLVTIRQRLAFMTRVRDLSPPWLAEMEPVLPVVWVRDVLHQSQALSERYWLTGQDRIEARLTQISGVLAVLGKVHELRKTFGRHPFPGEFVRVRALAALNRIVLDVDIGALSEQRITEIRTQLDGLADWTVASRQGDCYWGSLGGAIDELNGKVKPADIADAAHRPVVASLQTDLQQKRQAQPQGFAAMTAVEDTYARLKLLWERRELDEFPALVALQAGGASLPALFRAADDAVWTRLERRPPIITLPQARASQPVFAYEPLTFLVQAPPGVAETHLFEHGLVFRWSFNQVPAGRNPHPQRFPGESRTPSVVAYADRPSTFAASATIERPGTPETISLSDVPVPVGKSVEFRTSGMFESVELTSFAIAGAIALVTGLSLLYAKTATFGSLQDYLGLFLWGVGVDQGKNLVQAMKG